MILYNHSYNSAKNQIEITPVKVTEREKTFKTETPALLFYKSVINKTMLDKLSTAFGFHMVSSEPRGEDFKQMIINEYNQRRQAALSIATQAEGNITRIAKQSTINIFPAAE